MTKGPIMIVEDDKDDLETFMQAIKDLGINNELRTFSDCKKALDYLYTTTEQPFIILADVNIPRISGLQFKETIQKDDFLRNKGIPFVFISTNDSHEVVRQAQVLSVQGFFKKPDSDKDTKDMFRKLFDYWELCRHINNT